MQRFTVYRRNISKSYHYDANPDSEAQFEGVIWTDGTVSLRWLTATNSWSTWDNIVDMLNVHGHLEYGTEIVWHDGEAPFFFGNRKLENLRRNNASSNYQRSMGRTQTTH